VDNQNSVTDQY